MLPERYNMDWLQWFFGGFLGSTILLISGAATESHWQSIYMNPQKHTLPIHAKFGIIEKKNMEAVAKNCQPEEHITENASSIP